MASASFCKHRVSIITGHYGTGKTEFAVNLALALASDGEQVMVARPNLFGPEPEELRTVVYESLHYRLMAHTAEDLCEMCMPQAEMERCGHDDVRHGFVIAFPETKPEFDISEV